MPSSLVSKYSALQNSNTGLDFNAQFVHELQSDNSHVYLSKIEYGISDEQGRPSMYADSLVFDLKEFVSTPCEVLETMFPVTKTVSADLLKCVYNAIATKTSIYIVGSENIVDIYSYLFLSMRKTVTFSTHKMRTHRTIIFSKEIPVDPKINYYDLKSGKTNVKLKKFDDYGFIDEIAGGSVPKDLDYFKSFEKELNKHGCAGTTSLTLFKFAYEFDKEAGKAPKELLKKFNELLGINVPNRNLLDKKIIEFFLEILEKKIELNDVLILKIASLPQKTSNESLIKLSTSYIYELVKNNYEKYKL
jgi:hypothetical protein